MALREIGFKILYPLPNYLFDNQENLTVNKDQFESKWKQIRSQTTAWWSLMSDSDLEKVDKSEIKFDKYVTLLQVKYGYTRQQAKSEISDRVAGYEAVQKENSNE
jgi:hypothetical protein